MTSEFKAIILNQKTKTTVTNGQSGVRNTIIILSAHLPLSFHLLIISRHVRIKAQ